MIKKIMLVFVLLAASAWAAHITDLDGLKSAVSAGGDHTIAAGSYVLDSDLTIAKSTSITYDDSSGDVIVDGNNLHAVIFQTAATATTIEVSGASDTQRIVFEDCNGTTIGGVYALSTANVLLTINL